MLLLGQPTRIGKLKYLIKKKRFLIGQIVLVFVLISSLTIYYSPKKSSSSIEQPSEEKVTDVFQPRVADENKPTPTVIRTHSVAAEDPRYLIIPSLEVHAPVKATDIKSDGALDVPQNIYWAGWYKYSARSTSNGGVAIYTGHFNGPNYPGLFHSLKSINTGAEIIVENGNGSKATYRVVQKESKMLEDLDFARLFEPITSGKQGLNIITCDGQYNDKSDTWDKRLMVFAERVS